MRKKMVVKESKPSDWLDELKGRFGCELFVMGGVDGCGWQHLYDELFKEIRKGHESAVNSNCLYCKWYEENKQLKAENLTVWKESKNLRERIWDLEKELKPELGKVCICGHGWIVHTDDGCVGNMDECPCMEFDTGINQKLEQELSAANARIKELESVVKKAAIEALDELKEKLKEGTK